MRHSAAGRSTCPRLCGAQLARAGWAASYRCNVLLRLENDLFPWLGSRPVASIEADELLMTIRRIESRGAYTPHLGAWGYQSGLPLRHRDRPSQAQSGC